MKIDVRRAEYNDIQAMRELYRQEANCQIRYDSLPSRGLTNNYLVYVDNAVAGYGAVLNRYDPNRLIEFYTLPSSRRDAVPLFRALLDESQATHIAAQTNIAPMLTLLYDFAQNVTDECLLFADAFTSHLTCTGSRFRRRQDKDTALFAGCESPGDYVIEANGIPIANGGFLCHYNPPYADLFMEVEEGARRQGYGSFLVQELKRVCYEAGKQPAARCNVANVASRRTLEKAGMLPCGRLLVGEVKNINGTAL